MAAVVAAVPILVLHSGLHKNDVLEAFFAVLVFAGAARWLALGCVASLVEASIALLLSVGTKVNGFIFVVAAAPLFLAGLYRHRASVSAPRFLSFALASFTASMFTGSACYVANLVATHRFVERPDMTGGAGYGDWSNLWQYTAMVILHPFEAREAVVWNPFDRRYFWWPTNDVWMSHFGLVATLLALAAVPCAVRYRARAPSSSLERIAASLAALAAYALTLPSHMHPRGFIAMYGRNVVFVAPFVVAWTVSPLILEIDERGRRWRRGIELAVGAACGVGFVRSADTFGVHDAYAPIAWVEHLLHHPEDRIPFVRRNRAASVFDRNVGPDVSVAMDVGYDTWIYPAYGEHWTRDVRFLAPGGGGHVSVPDDVDWVLVDRSWNYFFGNPDFVDMSRIDLLGKGMPTAEDLAVYRQLEADPRFSLVYEDRPQLQAIFHRNGERLGRRGHFDEEARPEDLREALRSGRRQAGAGGHEEGPALGAEVVREDHALAEARCRHALVLTLAELAHDGQSQLSWVERNRPTLHSGSLEADRRLVRREPRRQRDVLGQAGPLDRASRHVGELAKDVVDRRVARARLTQQCFPIHICDGRSAMIETRSST